MLRAFRALPPSTRIVLLATLLNRVGTMALPFLVLYLTAQRHFAPAAAGALLGCFGAGSLLAGPLAGWLVGRIGARTVLSVSLCGSAAFLLSLPFASGRALLAVLVFGWALTGEAFRPAAAMVVAAEAPPGERRNAFAKLRMVTNLGMAIGPAIGGLLAASSYFALFAIDAATALAAAAILLLPAARAIGKTAANRASNALLVKPSQTSRSPLAPLAIHLLGVALIALVAYQGVSTLPLFMTSYLGLHAATYGFVFALNGLLIVLFEVPLTLRLSGQSHRRLLTLGAALTGIGFGAFALTRTLVTVIAATLVWTLGEMLCGPASAARVADLGARESPRRQALFLGLHSAVWSAAFALGPWLGMDTLLRAGPTLHWSLFGALALVAALLFASQGRDEDSLTGP